jgi:hypothetical protein
MNEAGRPVKYGDCYYSVRPNSEFPERTLECFLKCKSDYDMTSFSAVYLSMMKLAVDSEDGEVSLKLAQILMVNTVKVWRRGTSGRVWATIYKSNKHLERTTRVSIYTLGMIMGIR